MKKFFLTWAIVLLTACASVGGGAGPQTFNQKLFVAASALAEMRNSTATLLQAKRISVEDAEHLLEQTDMLRAGLDLAHTTSFADPTAADAKLQQTLLILQATQAYLLAREARK